MTRKLPPSKRTEYARVRIRRAADPNKLAGDLRPGDVVHGCVIQHVERRSKPALGEYWAVFYTAPNHVGRHKLAECSDGVTAGELFETYL